VEVDPSARYASIHFWVPDEVYGDAPPFSDEMSARENAQRIHTTVAPSVVPLFARAAEAAVAAVLQFRREGTVHTTSPDPQWISILDDVTRAVYERLTEEPWRVRLEPPGAPEPTPAPESTRTSFFFQEVGAAAMALDGRDRDGRWRGVLALLHDQLRVELRFVGMDRVQAVQVAARIAEDLFSVRTLSGRLLSQISVEFHAWQSDERQQRYEIPARGGSRAPTTHAELARAWTDWLWEEAHNRPPGALRSFDTATFRFAPGDATLLGRGEDVVIQSPRELHGEAYPGLLRTLYDAIRDALRGALDVPIDQDRFFPTEPFETGNNARFVFGDRSAIVFRAIE
jgi:hypothetical protein